MNLFVLHSDPVRAARMHCDKHLTKMLVETAQLLSYAHRLENSAYADKHDLYALNRGHAGHPCTLWLLEDARNYRWSYDLLHALLAEYDYRYQGLSAGKYARVVAMADALRKLPKSYDTPSKGEPPLFVMAMGKFPECMGDCAVESYRRYYIMDKQAFAVWNNKRPAPKWWRSGVKQFKRTKDITKVIVT